MRLDRRTTLKAIGAAGVAAGMEGTQSAAAATLPPSVIVYSGRLEQSVAFARMIQTSTTLLVDASKRDLGLAWRDEIASHLALHPGPVEGYTLWSDLVISQGMGREMGLKSLTETRVAGRDGKGGSFRWTLR